MTSRALLPALVALALAACATAGDEGPRRVLELNRKAMESYRAGKLERARRTLLDAVLLGKTTGLATHNAMARTYLNLGAVYIAKNTKQDRTRGMRQLGLAVRIQPDIEPAPDVATPALRRALATVQAAHARRRPGAAPGRPAARIATPSPGKDKPPTPEESPPPEKRPAREQEAIAEEPDVPAQVPQPVYCPVPDTAPPGVEVPLRCVARPGLAVQRMLLFYRPQGSETFTAVPMARSRKGWYQAVVPAAAVAGSSLHYYVEAHGPARRVTTNGQAQSPNLLLVRAGAPPASDGVLAAARPERREAPVEVKEENPLEDLEEEQERTASEAAVRGPRTFWLGAAAGSGYGWHPRRTLEFSDRSVTGRFSSGGLLAVLPEIGFQIDDRFVVSVQSRHQLIPERGSGDALPGSPPHSAHAVLVRLHYLFGAGRLRPFATASVGGGDGFRLVIPPTPGQGLARNDTVRGGPFVLGPGAGLAWHFGRHLAWVLEARGLVGLPDFAAVGELATGAQLGF